MSPGVIELLTQLKMFSMFRKSFLKEAKVCRIAKELHVVVSVTMFLCFYVAMSVRDFSNS